MTDISVVVPVYKCEACLGELCGRLDAALSAISPDYEIILVEDCGGDNSWPEIRRLAASDSRIKGIKFSRNFGQHYGITAGLDHAEGEFVVIMDCDLQDRPEEIGRLHAKAVEGYDVVVAARMERTDGFLKRATAQAFYAVFRWMSGMPIDSRVGNFRIMRRKVVLEVRRMRESLRLIGGLIHWLGFKTATVEVAHAERFAGTTSYNWGRLIKLAANVIVAYSDKPLRIAIGFGAIMSILSFAMGLYFLLRVAFYGAPIVGWASVIVSLYFLGGIMISILGIIGLYLGKTFNEAKRRPLYVVSERIGFEAPIHVVRRAVEHEAAR